MSIFKINDDDRENFTLVTSPHRTFSSSSSGVTGSLYVYSRRNKNVKEVDPYVSGSSRFNETKGVAEKFLAAKRATGTNIQASVEGYIGSVNAESLSTRLDSTVSVRRSVPGVSISKDFLKKMTIVDTLMPYYRSMYPTADFSVTNFNCINFFTASGIHNDAALIYPVEYSSYDAAGTPLKYVPSGAFTIDFHIKPSHTSRRNEVYHAGTILHISSTFVVSIVTGSNTDELGRKKGFRILFQLSQSADTAPSKLSTSTANNTRSFPNDLSFMSSDNSLLFNTWHHVAIRWGTDKNNHGSGSFVIDSTEMGRFSIPSSSIKTSKSNAAALYIGNYFNGAASIDQRGFFNNIAATNEGVKNLVTSNDPTGFSFTHPLNAELHGLRITPRFLSLQEIMTASYQGPASVRGTSFYLPILFVSETRHRTILTTPFESVSDKTSEILNARLLFTADGHIMNVENYLREFVNGEYPRLYNLTSSVNTGTFTSGKSADDHLYDSQAIRARNLLILPCDDGTYLPNFDILLSGSSRIIPSPGDPTYKFTGDSGARDMKVVSLRDMINPQELMSSVSGSLESLVFGANPTDFSIPAGEMPAVFQKTRDNTSNSVVIFDVPRLYYGRRILPGSFTISDSLMTGSSGGVTMTIKDDGYGNLYRANSLSAHAKWNSVGNIFYNEGLVFIKSPLIPFFGKSGYELSFRGESSTFISRLNLVAKASSVNSSSNPSYIDINPSNNANDADDSFVYITGINIHDENMNVVARTHLAQPVIKRGSDKIMFRVKMDW